MMLKVLDPVYYFVIIENTSKSSFLSFFDAAHTLNVFFNDRKIIIFRELNNSISPTHELAQKNPGP